MNKKDERRKENQRGAKDIYITSPNFLPVVGYFVWAGLEHHCGGQVELPSIRQLGILYINNSTSWE